MHQLLGEEIHVFHAKLLGRKSDDKAQTSKRSKSYSPRQAMCQISPPEGMPLTITALETTKLKNFNTY